MKLGLAISLSLLGHGIILIPWSGTTELAVNSTPSSFQVALVQQPASNTRAVKTSDAKAGKKSDLLPAPQKNIAKEITETQDTRQLPASSNKINTEAKALVISRITHEIENHFRYPLLARRNGWQGKVELALLVEADGSIDNVRIKSGSGYKVLDQSALNALLKIKKIQYSDNLLKFYNQEIIIPVIYHLEEG